MSIEIRKPNLVQRLTMRIQAGQFQDADEFIEKALDALDEQSTVPAAKFETGSVVLAALQASPYPEIDLIPSHVQLGNLREVIF